MRSVLDRATSRLHRGKFKTAELSSNAAAKMSV
jgi:hypothetical protein